MITAFLPAPSKIVVPHILVYTRDTLVQTDTFTHLLTGGGNQTHIQCIHAAEFNSIEPQFLGEDIHVAFHRKAAL